MADMVEIKAELNGHAVTEKASRIQVWQSKAIDLFYTYRALGGVGNMNQSSRVQDGGKSQHAKRGASNVHSAESSKYLARTFTRCNWVEVASA